VCCTPLRCVQHAWQGRRFALPVHPSLCRTAAEPGYPPRHPDEDSLPSTRIFGDCMSKPGELDRDPPPASEAPDIIYLPPPANDQAPGNPPPQRKNGRAISTKPGSQISRRRMVKDPRDARLDIRCTTALRAKAEAAAEAAGLSVAGYVEGLIDGAPGPRVHRRATLEIQELVRIHGGQSKRGGNLNQCAKNLNIIRRLAEEAGISREHFEMIAGMLDLYREAIAENNATCAEIRCALGMRSDDDY
jgi:hypothetical protein